MPIPNSLTIRAYNFFFPADLISYKVLHHYQNWNFFHSTFKDEKLHTPARETIFSPDIHKNGMERKCFRHSDHISFSHLTP